MPGDERDRQERELGDRHRLVGALDQRGDGDAERGQAGGAEQQRDDRRRQRARRRCRTPNAGTATANSSTMAAMPVSAAPVDPRAEVDAHRQRRAAHALEQALVASGREAEDERRVARGDEAEDRDRRRVELGEADRLAVGVDLGVAVERAEEHDQDQREREGEDERARVAQRHPHAAGDPADAAAVGARALMRPPPRSGELEIDVLERGTRDGQVLELHAAGRGPVRARGARSRVGVVGAEAHACRARRSRRPGSGSVSWKAGARKLTSVVASSRPSSSGVPSATTRPLGEHDDAVGEVLRLVHVVRGQQDRLAERAQVGDQSPTTGAARPGRSPSSARRGRSARGRRRGRARGRAGGAGRRRGRRRAQSPRSASPTSSSSSCAGRGFG